MQALLSIPAIDASPVRGDIGVADGHVAPAATRKEHPMKRLALITILSALPLSAIAMPVVGDIVGTNPTDATAALEKAGCKVPEFEAEGGKIEAKCHDESGALHEVYIDPKTGAVTQIKAED